MAHNARIRAPGFWVALGVLDAAEMELVDSARYLAIHEGGGTWAITDNVTIGAVGAQSWYYTLPVLCDDLTAVVKSTKNITFNAGSLLLVNGTYTLHGAGSITGTMTIGAAGSIQVISGRNITIQTGATLAVVGTVDLTGTATIAVGATAKINVTGEVDVLAAGAIVFTDGGLIKGVARLHSAAEWYFTNGSTTRVLGAFKFDTGSTGSIESGVTFNVKGGGSFTLDVNSDLFMLGEHHIAGPEILSGTTYRALRSDTASTSVDEQFDPRLTNTVVIPTALVSGRSYNIDVADLVDIPDGVEITFRRDGNADPNGALIVANGVGFFQFHGGTQSKSASVTFEKWSGLWKIKTYSGRYGTDCTPAF